jgi:hypothetical protein
MPILIGKSKVFFGLHYLEGCVAVEKQKIPSHVILKSDARNTRQFIFLAVLRVRNVAAD